MSFGYLYTTSLSCFRAPGEFVALLVDSYKVSNIGVSQIKHTFNDIFLGGNQSLDRLVIKPWRRFLLFFNSFRLSAFNDWIVKIVKNGFAFLRCTDVSSGNQHIVWRTTKIQGK